MDMSSSSGISGELSCSICLSIYTHPVMLNCGHNFCETCITISLDRQGSTGAYTCPECSAVFETRPALQKNLKLGNIIDYYRSTHEHAEGMVILCTYCVTSLVPAVKTCLNCEAALCQLHLKNHSKSAIHILTEPTASLQDRKCPDHNKLIKYVCTQDNSFLCSICCRKEKHNGHKEELISKAGEKKRLDLWGCVQKLTLHAEHLEGLFGMMDEHTKQIEAQSLHLKNSVCTLFRVLREELNSLETLILNEIAQQEKTTHGLNSLEMQKVHKEIKEVFKIRHQIRELCKIPDNLTLLKQTNIDVDSKFNYKHLVYTEPLNEEKIIVTLLNALSHFPDVITARKKDYGFDVEGSTDIIFDVNTADPSLALSHNCKEVIHSKSRKRCRPHLFERFYNQQVLSTKNFCSGKHYWEVRVFDNGNWSVGVTYKSVLKSGSTSRMGANHKSWCITWYDQSEEFYAQHDDVRDDIFGYRLTHEFGIYLDYEDGILSFYELANPIQHLHTFVDVFTEPLYAGIFVDKMAGIRICG